MSTTQGDLPSLIGQLRIRMQRVENLGQELANLIQQWMSTQPFDWDARIAEDRLSWSLNIERRNPPPLEEWGTLFSDAVHQLRSTLDNLTWGLATLDGAEPSKPRAVQFPIIEHQRDWKGGARNVAELPLAAQSAIEQVQPFQRASPGDAPSGDPLLLLNRLNNTDKHRFLIQPELNPVELLHQCAVEFHSEKEAAQNVPPDVTLSAEAFSSSTTLLLQRTRTPIKKVSGNFEFKGQVVVQDRVSGSLGVTRTVSDLLVYVSQVLDHVLHSVAEEKPSR